MYVLMYRPTSDLGARYPHWVIATFRTREVAEAVVPTCPNADMICVVECGESSTLYGESRRETWENEGGPEGASTPESPALTTLRILETERG